jgi:hypothetical protein
MEKNKHLFVPFHLIEIYFTSNALNSLSLVIAPLSRHSIKYLASSRFACSSGMHLHTGAAMLQNPSKGKICEKHENYVISGQQAPQIRQTLWLCTVWENFSFAKLVSSQQLATNFLSYTNKHRKIRLKVLSSHLRRG